MSKQLLYFLLAFFMLALVQAQTDDGTTDNPKGFIDTLFQKIKYSVDDTYTVSTESDFFC